MSPISYLTGTLGCLQKLSAWWGKAMSHSRFICTIRYSTLLWSENWLEFIRRVWLCEKPCVVLNIDSLSSCQPGVLSVQQVSLKGRGGIHQNMRTTLRYTKLFPQGWGGEGIYLKGRKAAHWNISDFCFLCKLSRKVLLKRNQWVQNSEIKPFLNCGSMDRI